MKDVKQLMVDNVDIVTCKCLHCEYSVCVMWLNDMYNSTTIHVHVMYKRLFLSNECLSVLY